LESATLFAAQNAAAEIGGGHFCAGHAGVNYTALSIDRNAVPKVSCRAAVRRRPRRQPQP